MTIHSS
jgi:hypothetical protein